MATAARTDVDLLLLLCQASHVLTAEMAARLAELGITPRVHCVLSKATREPLTQIRLAELCDLDKTTMVVTLDDLEKRGLAARRPAPDDRRARIVVVTDAGERLLAQADAIVAEIYDDVLAALPAEKRTGFLDGLVELVNGRLSASTSWLCQPRVRRRSGA